LPKKKVVGKTDSQSLNLVCVLSLLLSTGVKEFSLGMYKLREEIQKEEKIITGKGKAWADQRGKARAETIEEMKETSRAVTEEEWKKMLAGERKRVERTETRTVSVAHHMLENHGRKEDCGRRKDSEDCWKVTCEHIKKIVER
jgi:hypothetical protein